MTTPEEVQAVLNAEPGTENHQLLRIATTLGAYMTECTENEKAYSAEYVLQNIGDSGVACGLCGMPIYTVTGVTPMLCPEVEPSKHRPDEMMVTTMLSCVFAACQAMASHMLNAHTLGLTPEAQVLMLLHADSRPPTN